MKWNVPLDEAGIPDFPGVYPAEFTDGDTAVIQVLPWLFAVNTDLLPVDEAPQEWADLLDPKYAGTILLADPNVSGAYMQLWNLVRQELGDNFLTQVAAQDMQLYASGSPAIEALSAGEGFIEIPSLGALVAGQVAQGAPLDLTIPNLTTGVEIEMAVSTDASNPNAARLFAHYVMSEEGQVVLNEDPATYSVFDTSGLPSEYQSPVNATDEEKALILQLLGLS
jgi:iron(III) transport system substrate-binding protein